jgi:hypothetical protein
MHTYKHVNFQHVDNNEHNNKDNDNTMLRLGRARTRGPWLESWSSSWPRHSCWLRPNKVVVVCCLGFDIGVVTVVVNNNCDGFCYCLLCRCLCRLWHFAEIDSLENLPHLGNNKMTKHRNQSFTIKQQQK